MCCTTHEDRDARALAEIDAAPEGDGSVRAAFWALFAPGGDWRCRCGHGVPCRRKATGEDLVCDWCRETDRARWCAERAGARLAEAESAWSPGPLGVLPKL